MLRYFVRCKITASISSGKVVLLKTLKKQMEFHLQPLLCVIGAGLPSMLSLLTTPVFFRRPMGIMKTNIKCPNCNCPVTFWHLSYPWRVWHVNKTGVWVTPLLHHPHWTSEVLILQKLHHAGLEEQDGNSADDAAETSDCLLYTSPSPRD